MAPDSLFIRLDASISNRSFYIEQKNDTLIELKNRLLNAASLEQKYELSKEGAQNKYDLIHFYPGVKSAYEDDYLNKPNEFFGGENVTELYLKEMDEMTVLRPIADDALFYNSMTFFAQSLEGTADEIAEKVEEDIISSNPQYEK